MCKGKTLEKRGQNMWSVFPLLSTKVSRFFSQSRDDFLTKWIAFFIEIVICTWISFFFNFFFLMKIDDVDVSATLPDFLLIFFSSFADVERNIFPLNKLFFHFVQRQQTVNYAICAFAMQRRENFNLKSIFRMHQQAHSHGATWGRLEKRRNFFFFRFARHFWEVCLLYLFPSAFVNSLEVIKVD